MKFILKANMLTIALVLLTSCQSFNKDQYTILVGTYTKQDSKGIYTYRSDKKTMDFKELSSTKVDNPSFVILDKSQKNAYAVSEMVNKEAFVNAFKFDKKKGTLNYISKSKVGRGPCHVNINNKYNFLTTANYKSGTMNVIRIKDNGTLMVSNEMYFYKGTGPDSIRQEAAHAHCTQWSRDGKYLFVSDLGSDRLYRYTINEEKDAEHLLITKGHVKLPDGTGPRHFIFNKEGNKMYLISELSGHLMTFDYKDGDLTLTQDLIADSQQARGSADIHLSPDEKFLYTSHRLKEDGVSIFKLDEAGNAQKIAYQPTGSHPRNFAISPDGHWLLVACLKDNRIEFYKRDLSTGLLTLTDKTIKVSLPTCIQFVQ